MKLSDIFHIFRVKAETGLDKLISAETKLDVALHDNLEALNEQKKNAVQLFSSKNEFEHELEKVRKEVNRFKTQCEVLKNRGLKADDDDMRVAAAQYLENKRILDDLEAQKVEIDKTAEKVEKMLKRLNLNKSLLETKASALKTKIKFYKISENITDAGIVDIDNMFNEVDEMVNKMQYDQEASQYVNNLVNGNEGGSKTAKDAEIDDFINSL